MPYARNAIPPSYVNLEAAGFVHDTDWVDPAVTPQPIAVFDAASGQELTENGQVRFDSVVSDVFPIDTTPEGDAAYNVTYPAKPNAFHHNLGKEWNYKLLIPKYHLTMGARIRQPDNFSVKRFIEIQAPDAASIANWEVGHQVESSSGGYGTIYQISNGDSGPNAVVLDNYGGGHPSNSFENKTVTNTTIGESVAFGDMRLIGNNAKFFIAWVDDGTSHNGYSNGAISLGFEASYPPNAPGPEHGYVKIGFSTSDMHSANGHPGNEVPGMPDHPILFDVTDNGTIVEIWYERIRTPDGNNTVQRVWKKTERPGGEYPELTIIYQDTNGRSLSSFFENMFTHGYFFGNKNGGYLEDTRFDVLRLEYWDRTPSFLPLIGG